MPLYKYVSSSAAGRFFSTGMVRFTQPAEFNDPFELQPHVRGLADEETIGQQHEIAFHPDALSSQIATAVQSFPAPAEDKAKINVDLLTAGILGGADEALNFVTRFSDLLAPLLATQMTTRFNEGLGIFCLTEDPLNLLMWAHYADEHKGVVLEFEETHAFFNRKKGPQDDLRHFRSVSYTSIRPSIYLSRSDAIEIFYTKSSDWAYEREWRLIVPLADATKRTEKAGRYPICLFEVPAGAVRGVIVGCRTDSAESHALASLIRGAPSLQHVSFSRAEVDARHFALHRREIPHGAVDAWLAR